MHLKSGNIEYKINGNDFIFDCVQLLYYKCRKVNHIQIISYGKSYIDSPDWIKNKKAIINPINKKR